MVNVQCLKGPLLWVTESEMSRKAERIRLKDLSERDDTSSDVIPFVSIFGRIFNLMVPAEAQNFIVRGLTEHQAALQIQMWISHTKLKMTRGTMELSYPN